ncbi:Membrane-bound lytic murein transglycosylase D [BD1-7 clade bacterium]|uniref:Membrane-bound lytic murein transglycosylase D n=1 Tax=BD1-7 clade bacterium TaxID=2029982 RepID=A0A5S9QT41_9GAMM|nr:Membrane-bound lytic murein transglycosylase D [BD1-7 clade bacterium]CAA0122490.1 Membrane-bound lytic murein transglycosylase D [BD1-7 clade bacterium]
MTRLTLARFLSSLALASLCACSTQQTDTSTHSAFSEDGAGFQIDKEYLTGNGAEHCFPVDQDAFNHPIDQLSLPPSPDDNIWPRVQQGLALDYVDHPKVQAQLNWYKSHPEYLVRVQKRASRYLHHIVELLHTNNVPYDFALLPIVESAYEPFSYSHGQASGLWQFIPITANRFRLDRNWWQDERRDVSESTQAAISYLTYLYGFFDEDWHLAIAAYNAGEGTVRKAVRANKKRGKPTDFWNLSLPKETQAYVPKLIALSEIFRNPEKYGVELVPIANRPYFDVVDIDSQLDLSQASELLEVSLEEVYYLNPGLNRWATPPVATYPLKVPAAKKEAFVAKLAKLPKDQRITWQRHKVQSGDTVSGLAKRFNSDVNVIRQANRLSGNDIRIGQILLIPTAKSRAAVYAYSQNQLNNRRSSRKPYSSAQKIIHQVKPGESFWRIAKLYQTTPEKIAKWNRKSPRDTLKVGERLVIWSKVKGSSRDGVVKKVTYKVRNGDSLAKISNKFNVKVNQITQWNGINPDKYLQPGQRLKLYVNVMETY